MVHPDVWYYGDFSDGYWAGNILESDTDRTYKDLLFYMLSDSVHILVLQACFFYLFFIQVLSQCKVKCDIAKPLHSPVLKHI